ncbi:MAG: S8 family serine peptidase, partial [Bacteroidetes bacterium]|nr:S8 family serine peptidase [Bacteroidota bacterium]
MKKPALILLILILLAAGNITAQLPSRQHYWIFLKEKEPSVGISANSGQLGISERALKRRAKVLAPGRLIDQSDIPVSESVINEIRQTGVKIRSISRWFNAVSVEGTQNQIQALRKKIPTAVMEKVTVMKRKKPVFSLNAPQAKPLLKLSDSKSLDYGPSAGQLNIMRIPDLHAVGVTGKGVLIGMLDDGFNDYSTHNATKNADVIAEYDFIYDDTNTTREPWEITEEGDHGTATFSVIAAYDPGNMIGAAYDASFALGKTENDSSETHIEEDDYVEGLEWLERLGADIVSTSLGYKDFDQSTYSYWHKDLDGRTTIVARAASIAARKGVLLVTSMGNDGYIVNNGNSFLHADTTIVTPADADSIIAVGAASPQKELASFSGTGPTADGRIKPEVVAQGTNIYCAYRYFSSNYYYSQGTSFSAPLTAGAAALILSAHPDLTPMQVREAIIQTAVHINNGTSQTAVYPNNYYGYGFVDAREAALFYGPVFSNKPEIVPTDSGFTVTTKILSKYKLYPDSIFYYYRFDSTHSYSRVLLTPTINPNEYTVSIPPSLNSMLPSGYFTAREETGTLPSIPTAYALLQNYPNPFNYGTSIRFEVPVRSE